MLGIGKDFREHFADAAGGKRDPSEVIAEAVTEFAKEDWSESDRRWLRGLVETVKLARRTHAEPKIVYEMELLVDEPPFTWREYREVVEAWMATPTGDTLTAAIEAAQRRSGKSAGEAADDFVGSAITGYEQALDQASRTSGRPAYDAAMALSAKRLQLLEALFGGTTTDALQTACASKRQCAALFGVLQQWLHVRANREDAALRDRERGLLTTALSRCAEPRAMYQATDPRRDNSMLPTPGLDSDVKQKWLDAVRAPLIPPVLTEIVSWFLVPDGVASQGIGDGELFGTWLIESPDSPLYRDEASSSTVRDVFLKAMQEPSGVQSEHVRDNAFTYLLWLTEGRRSGSWIGLEERPAFLMKQSQLVSAAWGAIAAVPHQHRAVHGLTELRGRLLKAGIAEADLPLARGLSLEDPTLPKT